jgi:hypothetical protein
MTDLEALLEDIRVRLAHAKDGLISKEEALRWIEKDIDGFDKRQEKK